MSIMNLNANFLGGAGGSFEPQRANQAQLIITGLDQGGAASSADATLTLSVESFPIPKVSSGIVEIGYLNEKRKFAGNPTYEDMGIVFNDYVNQNTANVLWTWRQSVHDPVSGQTGFAANYKKTGYIQMYSPDGSIQRTIQLVGLWPATFDSGDINYMDEATIKLSITFALDKFYAEFAGISPDANAQP